MVVMAAAQQPSDAEQWVAGMPAPVQGVLLNPTADLVEGVEAEVRSARGAVSRLSVGPFPRAASRTGRARFRASGSPRATVGYRTARVVCSVHGVGMLSRR